MIVRDEHGIIVQHDKNNTFYKDGGDSARAAGLMAMCGSKTDLMLLNLFIQEGRGVRHPYQNFHNNPNNFTRDQLLCLLAGINSKNSFYIKVVTKDLFWQHAKRLFFCQNTHNQEGIEKPWYNGRDPLGPHHVGMFIKAAGLWWLYWFLPVAWAFMLLDMIITRVVSPTRETNQMIAMCAVFGTFWLILLNKMFDWELNTKEYWSGWRDQKEIGEEIIKYVNGRITSRN